MILKKTYYSISEVSKMLNIQEHTIRFWDSKLPDLSKRDNKGKTRFFNLKQIEKLSKLNEILKREKRIEIAQACFNFIEHRVKLDLSGWPDLDIFKH